MSSSIIVFLLTMNCCAYSSVLDMRDLSEGGCCFYETKSFAGVEGGEGGLSIMGGIS